MTRLALLLVSGLALLACESAAVPGAVCERESDCTTPLTCRLGHCRNACTASRDCPVGTRCLLDEAGLGACSVASDDRCESGGSTCPTGLTCLGGRCVNTCTSAADCPSDGECREAAGTGISFCFAPDREDAGPLASDAGPDAASGGNDGGDDGGRDAASDGGADGGRDAGTDAGPGCTDASCAIDLCMGEEFACAVRGDHHVVCWGSNRRGQLGDGIDATTPRAHPAYSCVDAGGGAVDCSAIPVEVLRADDTPLLATSIACTTYTACARDASAGRATCWGNGGNGELGATMLGSDRAVVLPDVTGDVDAITGGRAFFCATFVGSSTPRCWGDDSDGSFGRPNTDTTSPADVPHWSGYELAVGGTATCGLDGAGVVYCAGENLYGEIGTGGATPIQRGPIPIAGLGTATSVRAGDSFECALVGGIASCWGFNITASLGRVTPSTCGPGSDQTCPDAMPMPVSTTGSGDRFDTLWIEGYTSRVCARRQGARDVLCWGMFSQMGCEPGANCFAPHVIAPLEGARWVATSTRSACGILETGAVVCGGNDAYGQLGDDRVGPAGEITTTYANVCISGAC